MPCEVPTAWRTRNCAKFIEAHRDYRDVARRYRDKLAQSGYRPDLTGQAFVLAAIARGHGCRFRSACRCLMFLRDAVTIVVCVAVVHDGRHGIVRSPGRTASGDHVES